MGVASRSFTRRDASIESPLSRLSPGYPVFRPAPGGPDNWLVRAAQPQEASGRPRDFPGPSQSRSLLSLRNPEKPVVRTTQIHQPGGPATESDFTSAEIGAQCLILNTQQLDRFNSC